MLTRAKKQEIIQNTEKLLNKQRVLFFTKFSGIGVNKLESLRRELKKLGAEFKVIRKTLLQLALQKNKNININVLEMPGEIGLIVGYENEVEPAKAAVKFGKEQTTFQIISGFLNGNPLTGQEIIALAKLPTKQELLAQFIGVLQAPLANFQSVLSGNMRGFMRVLGQINKNK